jgi:hypothetical protein
VSRFLPLLFDHNVLLIGHHRVHMEIEGSWSVATSCLPGVQEDLFIW